MYVLNKSTASPDTAHVTQKRGDRLRMERPPVQRSTPARPPADSRAAQTADRSVDRAAPDLDALRARDPQAVLNWIYAERPAVRAMLVQNGVPQHRLAEVVQEVMYQALRSLPRFKGQSKVKTWLLAVAKNVARSRHRRETRHPMVSLATPLGKHHADRAAIAHRGRAHTPYDATVRRERRALVRRALQQLPAHYAQVIRLRDLEERSTKEVADVLGTTRGNVRVRLYRARQALKKLLTSHM